MKTKMEQTHAGARTLVVALALVGTLAASIEAQAGAIRAGFNTNSLAANDDGSTGFVNFGFSIDFFGTMATGGYVNNNGNVTLDGALSTYTPFPLLTTGRQIFAPFFADVDTRGTGSVTYGTGAVGGNTAWGANWDNVGYYNSQTNPVNDFQLVLIDRSDIGAGDFDFEFNIDQVLWETGSASNGGPGGLGGDSARVGWSNGGMNTFELAGSAVNGALLDGGPAATSLIQNDLDSNLSDGGTTQGRYFFQVRGGTVVPPNPVPVPSTLVLVALGLLVTGMRRRQRAG